MDNQNSQFDHNIFGGNNQGSQDHSVGSSYEYVFSSGGSTGNGGNPKPQKPNGGKKILISVITILLCAAFSFAAGFGGAFYAFQLLDKNETDNINAAPDQEDLYNSDPQSVLDKSESQTSPYGSAGEDVFEVSQVVQKVQNAVVVIDATVNTSSSYFGSQTSVSSGSGVIISADGYILTCHHVVENAVSVTVTLNSGSKYDAALVGSDENSDLAVLRIEPQSNEPLTYVEQGCSADLVVGEKVVAIGNPLGTLGGTVTDGIISATERVITTSDGTTMTLLQTNAAINSGNSGGGLFNLDGKLIGIVNAKYAAEGVEGLAFAIPIDSAYVVELDLIEYGYVRGIADHGLELLDITSSNLNYYYYKFRVDTIGVYVVSSEYNSDLKNKDRIVSVNGIAVTTKDDIEAVMENCKVGDQLTIVYSRDGKEYSTTLTLQEYVPDYYKNNDLQ
ncbi:MAG: trypsin-like peptidase domain-containing protein [Clostridia bacterium]|nr:trypsin-like peptidase domain-containing protein [Clostridia bacterium]